MSASAPPHFPPPPDPPRACRGGAGAWPRSRRWWLPASSSRNRA